jgi:hypothetical protein
VTFDLLVDHAFDLQRGSMARVFWGSDSSDTAPGGTPYNLTVSKDIITWPGKHTYTLDLATLSGAVNGGLEPTPTPTPWAQKSVRHFRIDPFEFGNEQVTFHMDNVKLAADDETLNNSFTIKWNGSDPDAGQNPVVSLFYDTDRNPGNGGLTAIASGLPLSAGQYNWNTSGVPAGTYYLYAQVTDGINTTAAYSTGPLKVSNAMSPSNPIVNIDAPAPAATVTAAFEVTGWAIDTAAPTGTGVDGMQYWIFPSDGAAPGVFLGTGSYGAARVDVGGAFGTQFTNAGYHFTVTGMQPGAYVLGVYAHSTVTNSYTAKKIHIVVSASTLESIDLPAPESTIAGNTFAVAGWAIDRRASDIGVDALHVYVIPNPGTPSQGAAIFLGVATQGIARSDVQALYGPQFLNSGYQLNVDRAAAGLTAGVYDIAVWAHSTFDGSFNNVAVVRVTLQ